ncbi:hypothetical protein A2U01_0016805 [Trifolium medium]|uniref:Uncharacterized protein n=1 Tax=Trifolium medium TaxID=97028 RepID=A0A392N8C3_9FABA|nr:hypothetical protein [Trifolium medium]
MSRCHAIYAIMKEEPISVGGLIARSIKTMCKEMRLRHPWTLFGRKFFLIAQKAIDKAYEAYVAAAPPPPPPPLDYQHQFPPHIPKHQHYSDFELGMAVTQYNTT